MSDIGDFFTGLERSEITLSLLLRYQTLRDRYDISPSDFLKERVERCENVLTKVFGSEDWRDILTVDNNENL